MEAASGDRAIAGRFECGKLNRNEEIEAASASRGGHAQTGSHR